MGVLYKQVNSVPQDFSLSIDDYREMVREFGAMCDRLPCHGGLFMKWDWVDLIPGLSDIDTRVLLVEPTIEDWVAFDDLCGEFYLEMLLRHPEWARLLEHTPGACVADSEVMDPSLIIPDHMQWTFVYGGNERQRRFATPMWRIMQGGEWSLTEEVLHLKRFIAYCSPYDSSIDPPINLGPYEKWYPIHSRCWHYFTPAVLSAISLLHRRTYRGKREALAAAIQDFPGHGVFREVEQLATTAYQGTESWERSRYDGLERRMFDCLVMLLRHVVESIEGAPPPRPMPPGNLDRDWLIGWKRELSEIRLPARTRMLDGLRFACPRAGRLKYYLKAPSTFATERQIQEDTEQIRTWILEPFLMGLGEYLGITVKMDEKLDGPFEEFLSREFILAANRLLDISWLSLPAGAGELRMMSEEMIPLIEQIHPLMEDVFRQFSLQGRDNAQTTGTQYSLREGTVHDRQ